MKQPRRGPPPPDPDEPPPVLLSSSELARRKAEVFRSQLRNRPLLLWSPIPKSE